MLASLNLTDAVGLAIIGGFIVTTIIAISRGWVTSKNHRLQAEKTEKERRELKEKEEAAVDDTIQQLTWSMVGKPADAFNPQRSVGLIEQTAILNREFHTHQTENAIALANVHTEVVAFTADNARVLEKLVERLERTEEKAATAAAAVLDTASAAALAKEAVTAEAAAKVIATAVAVEVAKTLELNRGSQAPATVDPMSLILARLEAIERSKP